MSEILSKPINNTLEGLHPLMSGVERASTSGHSLKASPKPINAGLPILTPLYEIWSAASQDILARKTDPEHKIGLASIDDVLWGLRKKILITIGSRTSHGKTSFAVNMVKNFADSGNRIIYFTMETSKEHLLEKLFCNFCRVDNLKLLHGAAKDEYLTKKVIFENWIADIKLLIDDKYGYDFPSMLKVIEIIKPDFVIVDYIQMISTKGFRSKVEAIEEYVRKFAELAITKNFGAILISQINRSGVDDPTMSKFKWSGILEEHSRVAAILSYNREKGTYVVNVEKNAFGKTGSFYIKFEPEYSSFRDLTKKEIEEIEDRKNSARPRGGIYQSKRPDVDG